jgi:23S rRNA G2445 N2-methylase RlmL
MARRPYIYYAHTMPGLQEIAWSEVQARLPGAAYEGTVEFPSKNGLALFRFGGDAADLLSLRTTEDVFFLVQRTTGVAWGREGLGQIFRSIERNRFVEAGLAAHRAAQRPRDRGPRTFRVISRMVGRQQPYRRIDLERAVRKALRNRLGRRWRPVEDGGQAEFWANLIGSQFICGLRLSDPTMRHREYKRSHIAASLRPSVAAALVWLTDPEPGDVFLDPMCGAGTILVERGMAAPHRQLLGGDISSDALQAAGDNFGPRHKPRQLVRWDAGRLPVRSESVDKVAINPPFGKQLGTHRENSELYGRLFGELDRVLRSSGRAVVISSEKELVRQSVRTLSRLLIVRGYPATVLGLQTTVYIVERPR